MELSEFLKTLSELSTSMPGISILIHIAIGSLMIYITAIIASKLIKNLKDVSEQFLKFELPKLPEINRDNDKTDLKKRIHLDKTIEKLLTPLIDEFGASRVSLYQFHNHQKAISGYPFDFVVLTHEITANGVSPNTLLYEHNDIRIYAQMFDNIIIDDKEFIGTLDNVRNPIKQFLIDNGDKAFIAKPISEAIDQSIIIGCLVVTFRDESAIPADIVKRINKPVNLISGILSNGWGMCNTCAKYKKHGKNKCTSSDGWCLNYIPKLDDKPKE